MASIYLSPPSAKEHISLTLRHEESIGSSDLQAYDQDDQSLYKVLLECRYVHRDAIFTIHQWGQVAVTGTRGSTKPEMFTLQQLKGGDLGEGGGLGVGCTLDPCGAISHL